MHSEYDLQVAVVKYIRENYPQVVIIAGLGENQTTPYRRIDSYKKGYTKGQPDLILYSDNKYYSSLCIELKTPTGKGILSPEQKNTLKRLEDCGCKCLVSDNFNEIVQIIDDYMMDERIACYKCGNEFITYDGLKYHLTYFHKI
jgi:hypothetical protein